MQPPPRGCVLKPIQFYLHLISYTQPPPRGCVLKQTDQTLTLKPFGQPPPRGCVLKLLIPAPPEFAREAAASARLCVETLKETAEVLGRGGQPPPRGCVLKPRVAFGSSQNLGQPPPRGCVLKPASFSILFILHLQPPSSSCVLKRFGVPVRVGKRAAAAFERLCVETAHVKPQRRVFSGSRLRAAVC